VSVGGGRLAGLLIVLAVDLIGVSTLAVLAADEARESAQTDAPAHLDAALLAVCAGVGFVTWLLAVIGVALAFSRRGTAAHGRRGSIRRARFWIWAGLALNTVGSLGVAIAASVAPEPVLPDNGGALSPPFVVAMTLALAGAVVSLGYLMLLRPNGAERVTDVDRSPSRRA
jgi:hypothetical protein